jgi:hypothetical protein
MNIDTKDYPKAKAQAESSVSKTSDKQNLVSGSRKYYYKYVISDKNNIQTLSFFLLL